MGKWMMEWMGKWMPMPIYEIRIRFEKSRSFSSNFITVGEQMRIML